MLRFYFLAFGALIFSANLTANPVQFGQRPFYLIDSMSPGLLKDQLRQCVGQRAERTDFSIAHRGAPLQFPEHTKESYLAGIRMGAGLVECDVVFTKDKQLVCRHSQCDLHRTTNILTTPLAKKCRQSFVPANASADIAASAECCTSDITLDEFKSLQPKMDAFDSQATTVNQAIAATAPWRTDLYQQTTLMTFSESIKLFQQAGVKMIPELKKPLVTMPFADGYTQQAYAQQIIDELRANGVKPDQVFLQSFEWETVEYWLTQEPEFSKQIVFLDDMVDEKDGYDQAVARLSMLRDQGLEIIAPPVWALLTLGENNQIIPSTYAKRAQALGLKIITWTFERSFMPHAETDYYYRPIMQALQSDGDIYYALDVLQKKVGIEGIFSDWPATVTYYANCFGVQ